MVYNTKFFKIGMFKAFKYLGTWYVRTGRKYYTNVTANTNHTIPSLGTNVIQMNVKYIWTPT